MAQALSRGPQTVDGLVRASGQPPGVVAAALTLLQLRGWAKVLGALQLPAGPLLDPPSRGAPEPLALLPAAASAVRPA